MRRTTLVALAAAVLLLAGCDADEGPPHAGPWVLTSAAATSGSVGPVP